MENPRHNVAILLNHQAALLERAANQIRRSAQRVIDGDAGSPDEGHGHHFLVDQAQREVLQILTNSNFGEAFRHAAEADRVT